MAVCRDLSCWLSRERAEIPEGAIVHEVSCVGRCDQAPVAIVEERYPEARARRRAAARTTRTRARTSTTRVLRSFGGDPVPVLEDSGLQGHGRRRVPDRREVGRWSAGRRTRPSTSICNADEAEPGTFKDRQILAEQPHLVVEGMLIAMRAVGAEQGWVFIRHEYEPEERVLREELDRARAAGCSRTASTSTCSPRPAATSWARRPR